jgi:hypothetical protein
MSYKFKYLILTVTRESENDKKIRGMIMANRCWLCESDEESVDHLLLHCKVATALWNTIFSMIGVSWVMPGSVRELFAYWWPGGCSRSAVVWKMVPLCLMWCVWRERNVRCFEDSSRSFIIHYFLYTLYTWTADWLAPTVISFGFSFSLLLSPLGSPLYTPCVLWVAPICAFLYIF